MKKILVSWLLSLLLLAGEANAATITSLSVGGKSQAASATNVLTTNGNTCAVGSTLIVGTAYGTVASTLSSVADSRGNTYSAAFDKLTTTGVGIGFAYTRVTTATGNGDTITATFAGATDSVITTVCLTNLAPSGLDKSNNSVTGTATSATTSNTGTLSAPYEAIVGFVSGAANPGTYTCGSGYTARGTLTGGALGSTFCVQVVNSNGSVAFAPSWTNSVTYITNLMTFRSVSGPQGNMALMGVGQ